MIQTSDTQCLQSEKYLDNRLSEKERMRFEWHLTACDSCRKCVMNWEYTKMQYANWTSNRIGYQPTPPAREDAREFVTRLRNRMAEAPAKNTSSKNTSSKYTLSMRVLVRLAAILVVAIATAVYWRQSHPGENEYAAEPVGNPPVAPPPTMRSQIILQRISNRSYIKETIGIVNETTLQSDSEERIIARVAKDTVGLSQKSQLVIQQIHRDNSSLQLLGGAAVFEVSPRTDGGKFTVIANDITITVVGTRFAVEMNDAEVVVGVAAGTVLVEWENEKRILKAGNEIQISSNNELSGQYRPLSSERSQRMKQLLSVEPINGPDIADRKKAVPLHRNDSRSANHQHQKISKELSHWQQLIIDGNNSEAAQLIQSYLMTIPNDSEALMLLATAQKKDSQYNDAYRTYRKVIALSGTPLVNQARYLAGELAQNHLGRHDQAAELFESYLSHATKRSPNRPEAKLRLAKALLNLTQTDRAKVVLHEIIQEYGRTSVANRARNLLDDIP
jgi:TolA-binding protein